jgi:hypothetical protein
MIFMVACRYTVGIIKKPGPLNRGLSTTYISKYPGHIEFDITSGKDNLRISFQLRNLSTAVVFADTVPQIMGKLALPRPIPTVYPCMEYVILGYIEFWGDGK